MPQLTPFYFFNQIIFTLFLLILIIYVFSKYILPRLVNVFSIRVFFVK